VIGCIGAAYRVKADPYKDKFFNSLFVAMRSIWHQAKYSHSPYFSLFVH
jgi:hypothetical protein